MNIKYIYIILFIGLFSTILGCLPTKFISEQELLLTANKVKGIEKVYRQELKKLIKQKPNKKLFGIARFHMALYNQASKGKERKIKWWIKQNIGELPVLLDTVLTERTIRQMKLYLFSKGFFNNEIKSNIKIRNHKAVVNYLITPHEPYIINNITYHIQDPALLNFSFLFNDSVSIVRKWSNYDLEKLEEERMRITNYLKNDGLYNFSKEYIYYEMDSSLMNHRVAVNLFVKKYSVNESHRRYRINKIYVVTDFNPQLKISDKQNQDTVLFNGIYFISEKLQYRHSSIWQTIFIKPGNYYQQQMVNETYKRIGDLGIFKFIDISFTENTAENNLDCFIRLSPSKKQTIIVETEGTTSSGNPGVAASAIYRNRNIFHGAEITEFKINGGLEIQVDSLSALNTKELGASFNITIPKYLLPFKMSEQSQYFNPKTRINSSYNYEKRINYSLRVLKSSLSYQWNEFSNKTHFIYPFEINLVNSKLDPVFQNRLEQQKNIHYINSFREHVTAVSKYTFIFNNQKISKPGNFSFFRSNIELGGNFFSLVSNKWSPENPKIFNLSFPQFIKLDGDYRHYHIFDQKNTLVNRVAVGTGIPYGNSDFLPFEKTFYVGGPNSIRAWKIRDLGPGSYNDTTNLEQIGDIKLEANMEYRFDIFEALEGAVFVDAGNIWTIKKDPVRQGAQFSLNNFYKEIAIGSGFGFRFNFSFFVLRLDIGMPVRDPALALNNNWVIKNWDFADKNWRQNNIIYNLGIGYPF